MTLIEKINYYAKGVIAGIGAVVAFATVVVGVTSDGQLDGGELTTLITAGVTLIVTVISIVKKKNVDATKNPTS